MINIEKDKEYIYIYDNEKLLKMCKYDELKSKTDIDNIVDECVPQYCVHSRFDYVMEHHAKRLYLKMELHKILNID